MSVVTSQVPTPPQPQANPKALRRWIAPSLVSLAIHAVAGIVIGTFAIQTYMRSTHEPAPIGFIVDFERPTLGPGPQSGPDAKPSGPSGSFARDSARVATPANSPVRDDLATPAHSTNDNVDEALAHKIAERLAPVNSHTATGNATGRPTGLDDALGGKLGAALGQPLGGTPTGPTAPAVAPPASFAGLRASNAQSIAYVVDASGSLIGTLPVVRRELEESLRRLTPAQRFAVYFFQRNAALEPPADASGSEGGAALRAATPAAIGAVMRWAEGIRPAGRSNPLVALEKALATRPDVVFLLSTDITGIGEFEMGRDELLRRLDGMNPLDPATGRRPTRIQCVQFLDPDPLGTLQAIAERHGGADGFRFLSRELLGLNAAETAAPIK